jgi:hypothetical protein
MQIRSTEAAPLIFEANQEHTTIVESDMHFEKAGEYIIRAIVNDPSDKCDEGEMIFSPDFSNLMKRSIFAATSLVNCDNSRTIPVRILVTEPMTLFKGTRLGVLEKCSVETHIRNIGMEELSVKPSIDILHVFKEQFDAMPPHHAEIMITILTEYSDIFSSSKMDVGCAVGVEHHIVTGDSPPVAVNYRRTPIALEGKVDELIDKLVKANIIRPSQSPWNAAVVVVKKKNGDIRMCIDYRRLNAITLRPIFPIPDTVQLFDTLEGAKYFSSLDLSQGYYQVPMAHKDVEKTAFTTRQGQFEFLRMPFGLCSAPSTFQRLMHTILRNENWKQCLIYLDDILIFGKTLEEHTSRLRTVLQRFREAGLKLSPEKCTFLKQEVEYLGHVVNKEGIQPSTTKIAKIKNWPTPRNPEELRSFLGLCGYYRRHIRNYANIVAPLEHLCIGSWTKKGKEAKKGPFEWESIHCSAFECLKSALTTAPVLAFPTVHGDYILDTDASHDTVGAVLSQMQDGFERVIAYASHKLSKAERSYCVTRKELLAVYKYVKQFSHYLYGRQFRIRTDHKALTWLLNWSKPTTSQYCSWISELCEYDIKIEHRPGQQHANADALSRLPECQQCELHHEDPKKKRNVKHLNEQIHSSYCRQMHKTHSTQNTDPDITMIIKIMKSGKLLDKNPDELHCASREAKLLWKKRERLRIRGDELYFLTPDDKYKWVVPANERKRLVFSTHKGCGHIGITKTATLVKEKYFWPEMEYDIRILINTCKPCRERKSAGVRQLPEPQMTFTSFPFEKIALDITGPLRPCKSGERFILGIVDYFTKFPQLIPLHNTDSKTVAKALFQHWICIFGAPLVIHTDRGTDFESNLFHELCAINGISKTKTAPFYPKSDGLIERLFSTVKDMIFATTQDTSMDWKESLPIICMGLRSSIQRTTKVAPYEVLFGQRMRTPLCWQYPIPDEHIQKSSRSSKIAERQMVSEYILDLQYRLKQLHMSIRKTINNKRSIETTGNKISRPLPIGTVVMARILPITKGIDKPRFDGPYTIIHHLGKWTYRLKHTTTGKIIERNIHHVKTVNFAESMKIIRPQHSSGTSVLVPTIERPSRARVPPSRYGFSGI